MISGLLSLLTMAITYHTISISRSITTTLSTTVIVIVIIILMLLLLLVLLHYGIDEEQRALAGDLLAPGGFGSRLLPKPSQAGPRPRSWIEVGNSTVDDRCTLQIPLTKVRVHTKGPLEFPWILVDHRNPA